MTKYLAIFYGGATDAEKAQPMNEQTRLAFMNAWMKWATDNRESIIDNGAPLSRTKSVGVGSVSDIESDMTAYAIIQADSRDRAAEIFRNHPHLTLHPKNKIEVVEIKSVPA